MAAGNGFTDCVQNCTAPRLRRRYHVPAWEPGHYDSAESTNPQISAVSWLSSWSVLPILIEASEERMKIKIAFLALFVFAGAAALATAQDSTKTTHKKTRTLTGCLQKGDDANEYRLTTAKGGTWEIKSDTVKLGKHANHTVTITGVVANATLHGVKEDAKDEAKEHGMDKDSTEHGHMTVTSLKMVSDSCSK
jgi:hypothetical protein